MPVKGIEKAVRRAAADRVITAREAPKIAREAKKAGSKKPLDDVFNAIRGTNASVEAAAARLLCSSLDQKLSRKEWVAYVQKCTSPSGVWGPSGAGAESVSRGELPAAVRKHYDKWLSSSPDDEPSVVRLEVAGKPAFMMSQYSEWGTAFAVFDPAGKVIPLKQDVENVRREASRIQDAYDKHFRAPAMKAWKGAVEHTEIGVIRNYGGPGTLLEGAKRTAAMTAEVKEFLSDVKAKPADVRLFRHRTDGSLLAVAERDRRGDGPQHFALFSKQGKLVTRFTINL